MPKHESHADTMTAWQTPAGRLPLDVAARDVAHKFIPRLDPDFRHCCEVAGCNGLEHDEEHNQAMLDGIPQTATTPLELDLTAQAATGNLRRALRVYAKAASRPRKAQCWAYVQTELWNARQDALRAGVLKRNSEAYNFVSARYRDAAMQLETARRMERAGLADARV